MAEKINKTGGKMARKRASEKKNNMVRKKQYGRWENKQYGGGKKIGEQQKNDAKKIGAKNMTRKKIWRQKIPIYSGKTS